MLLDTRSDDSGLLSTNKRHRFDPFSKEKFIHLNLVGQLCLVDMLGPVGRKDVLRNLYRSMVTEGYAMGLGKPVISHRR